MTMTSKGFTKKGMTQSIDHYEHSNMKLYRKVNLTQKEIQNYLLMSKLYIGVMSEKLTNSSIIMQEGMVLPKYLSERKHYTEWHAWDVKLDTFIENITLKCNILQLRQVLKKNKIAHTDIKPLNIIVIPWSKYWYARDLKKQKLTPLEEKFYQQNSYCTLLIDNQNITSYGEIRKVGTPKVNCDQKKLMLGEIVDDNTDIQGFQSVLEYIDSFPEGIQGDLNYFRTHFPVI